MAKPVALANFGVHVEIWNSVTSFSEAVTFRFEDERTRDEFIEWMIRVPVLQFTRIRPFCETVYPNIEAAKEFARYTSTRPFND